MNIDSDCRLILGDAAEALVQIKDSSIDLTVTSPPYDKQRTYNGFVDTWNDQKWKDIMMQLYRVTAIGGVVVWVVNDGTIDGDKTGTSFKQVLFAKECGFNLHDTMIYHRHGMPNNSPRYSQDFEYMFVLSKGKPKTFNPIKVPCTYAGQSTSPTTREKDGRLTSQGRRKIGDTKKKSNIWHYQAGLNKTTKDKYAFECSAMFPEKLAEDHIITWTNDGDTVLDCFMGGGTTGKMALHNNRKFVGIEIDPISFDICRRRTTPPFIV
ncbi:site-specific DNA-methyltransferase [Vibrio coralliirubri]|uniref:DNA-methyltransferase n=1 Tax=Vibrio coralliirubri TaxID=1516159 RepID=UPI00228471F1|nr:site-specific DNA-methyltransferase [Vibrio coralliirubri]MCY9861207.1 site-specific DNA-methyltransferase [Vibrio coralliirubri]